jgi:hypothetical protein
MNVWRKAVEWCTLREVNKNFQTAQNKEKSIRTTLQIISASSSTIGVQPREIPDREVYASISDCRSDNRMRTQSTAVKSFAETTLRVKSLLSGL